MPVLDSLKTSQGQQIMQHSSRVGWEGLRENKWKTGDGIPFSFGPSPFTINTLLQRL